jgi:hypothetical protein
VFQTRSERSKLTRVDEMGTACLQADTHGGVGHQKVWAPEGEDVA